MRSMTGFGAASLEHGDVSLRAEVRAVNHKHLQVKLRLPAEFLELEPEVEALVKARLDRGAVNLNVSLASTGRSGGPQVNPEVAKRLRNDLLALAKQLKLAPELSLDTLAQLPGVVTSSGLEVRALEKEKKSLLKVVQAALAAMEKMREAEGQALADDLKRNRKLLEQLTHKIEKRMPLVVQGQHAALTRRVEELLAGRATLENGDLAREVALIADKLDVAEELTRLKSHFAQFDAILARSGPVGRQLDFLVQELLRESNTIGSKCVDAEVAHVVVEMKSLIERLREQVQNIE
ncbi:MAG TPA: YicC/YloC family endoribonuclease [Planctomycetota bacterium]|nr:YicC/YloC family endoribonuclease [Planctomycetota bacterium]